MRPLVIDNFAGGGGASTGIERAIGRPIDVAINHDPEAIAMHEANHPATRHFCQSILAIDPLDATGGQKCALIWFSPDCKHHSKAKGGKPREKNIRDLAWVVVHWIERLQDDFKRRGLDPTDAIDMIALENVEEFRRWGPLDADGMPIKEREGEEFDLFVRRIRRRGARVEFRELVAADYGAPTKRKRLYMLVRFDGKPIVWPQPTHGKRGSPDVLSGKLKPWRSAAECIDWSIPCPSIFERARPLKEATLRRIAHGVMRYVVNAAEPFIVDGCEIVGMSATGGEKRDAKPFVVGTAYTNTRASRVFDPEDPIPTATTQPELGVVDAAIVPITHASDGPGRTHDPADPLRTITTANGGELARVTATVAHLEKFSENSRGRPASEPLDTVMAGSARHGVVAATMVQAGYGERDGQVPRALDVEDPLGTIVAGGGKHAAVSAFLSHFYSSNTRGGQGDPTEPAKAVTAEGQHHAVVCAHMEQANTGRIGHPVSVPLSTIVSRGTQQRLVQTTMVEADALPPPLMERAVRVAAFLIKYYGNEVDGHGLDQPLGTVTTKDRFAVITVTIDAITYVVIDIGMRMLTRRELANAQGFPADYELAPIGPNGKPLSISSSIRMIGNSVCPDMAEALIRSNWPDLCASGEPKREMVA